MIYFIERRVDDAGFGIDEKIFMTESKNMKNLCNSEILGGSYNLLNAQHRNRKDLYEINHMPPKASYRNTSFENISDGKMPAILMTYKDHRGYCTTGNGELKYFDFPNKPEVRGYMRDELRCNDFCAALNADLEILFRKREFIFRYCDSCIQMVTYCNTLIENAPCNSDCPYYSK